MIYFLMNGLTFLDVVIGYNGGVIMATLILGNYSCEYNRVDKTNYINLDNNTVTTVELFDTGTDEDKYIFIVDGNIDNFKQYNYCSIDGKYYFLEPYKVLDGGMCEMLATFDFLYNNKEKIYNSVQLVTRNAKNRNAYLVDNEMTFTNYDLIDCYEFPNAINNDSIILITVG